MRSTSRPAVWIFLVFQALYGLTSSGNVFRLADEFEVYFQAESLADRGRLSVPQALALTERVDTPGGRSLVRPIFFGKIGRDGRPYAPYGPLAAVLSLPHHLAARGVAAGLGIRREALPAGRPWLILVSGLTSLATSTAAALAVAGFFQACLLLGASHRRSLGLAVILGAGTVLWPYGTSNYSEAFVAAGLAWATVGLLAARDAGARGTARSRVATVAALLFATALVKPTAIVFVPGLLVAVAAESRVRRRDRALALGLLGLALLGAGLTHAGYNVARFGAPFDFGYAWGETVSGGTPTPFALDALPTGLAVLLLSPGKSMFVWAPVLFAVLLHLREAWRADRPLVSGLAATLLLALAFYGSYFFPEGGYSHGPRHLVPLVPLLLLPLALGPAVSPTRLLGLGLAGSLVCLLAVMTSFVEDQAIGQDLRGQLRENYYERVVPDAGRPWNRYRLGYVPFVAAMGRPGWGVGGPPGAGIDFFPLHLARARRLLPDMQVIPAWFPWALPAGWSLLLAAAAAGAYSCSRDAGFRRQASSTATNSDVAAETAAPHRNPNGR